jgi:hypothetical protein
VVVLAFLLLDIFYHLLLKPITLFFLFVRLSIELSYQFFIKVPETVWVTNEVSFIITVTFVKVAVNVSPKFSGQPYHQLYQ